MIGFKYFRLHLHHGIWSELPLASQLVQFRRHGWILDNGHSIGVLLVSRHREIAFHPVDHAGRFSFSNNLLYLLINTKTDIVVRSCCLQEMGYCGVWSFFMLTASLACAVQGNVFEAWAAAAVKHFSFHSGPRVAFFVTRRRRASNDLLSCASSFSDSSRWSSTASMLSSSSRDGAPATSLRENAFETFKRLTARLQPIKVSSNREPSVHHSAVFCFTLTLTRGERKYHN